MPRTVYISGPMRGLPDYNYPAFAHATRTLRHLGYEVLSPHESFGGDKGLTFEAYMRADINLLLQVDELFLLPGYDESVGCHVEMTIAEALGLPMREFYTNASIGYSIEPRQAFRYHDDITSEERKLLHHPGRYVLGIDDRVPDWHSPDGWQLPYRGPST